jgi:peptide/nickel transport system permease protein
LFVYTVKRVLLALPIMLGVTIVCFALVYLAPGDPLVSVLPPDASQEIKQQMMVLYGFDRPYHEQYFRWLWPVDAEIGKAVGNTLMLAALATFIGFVLGTLFGFVAGYFRDTWIDRAASAMSVFGVSVPHYWLGMVLVIIFSATLGWLPATGAGPGGSEAWLWNWEHIQHLILPAITMSVIPMGIIARTVRALVGEILSQEFIAGLRAKGLSEVGVFTHVVKNAAPTALAVMGIQLGYLLGGSILIETVFSWPGTGLLLNDAIFQRDLPLLQGTILVLAMFFVVLNLAVDVMQTALDPRIQRA